jgi:hypothetical protein
MEEEKTEATLESKVFVALKDNAQFQSSMMVFS